MSDPISKEKGGNATITSTAFNLFSCIVGVGVLSVPLAVQQAGIGLSLLMFALVIVCVVYTTQMLIKLSKSYEVNSYEDLTTRVLGRAGYIVLCVMCIILNGGAVVSYVVAMVQCIKHELTDKGWEFMPQLVVGAWCVLVCLPLSLMPDWESLAILSKIKMVVFSLLTAYILIQGYILVKNDSDRFNESFKDFLSKRETWVNEDWMKSLGIILFSIVCHDSIFPLYNSMRSQSIGSFKKMTSLGLFLALLFNITIGVFTFLIFRENIPDNVLTSEKSDDESTPDTSLFDVDDKLFLTARLMFFAVISLTLPVCVALAREYLVSMWLEIRNIIRSRNSKTITQSDPIQEDDDVIDDREEENDDDESEGERPTVAKQHNIQDSTKDIAGGQTTTEVNIDPNDTNVTKYNVSEQAPGRIRTFVKKYFDLTKLEFIMTLVVFVISLISGLAIGNDLDVVVGVIGSFCAGFLGFILPGIIYLYFAYTRKYGGFLCIFNGNSNQSGNGCNSTMMNKDVELGQLNDGQKKERTVNITADGKDLVELRTRSQRVWAGLDLLVALSITLIGLGLWANETREIIKSYILK